MGCLRYMSAINRLTPSGIYLAQSDVLYLCRKQITSGISLAQYIYIYIYTHTQCTDCLPPVYLCNEQVDTSGIYVYDKQMDCFRYIFAMNSWATSDIATTDRLTDCLRYFTAAINHTDYLRYVISATHKWTTSGMISLQHTNGLPQHCELMNVYGV